MSEHNYQDSVEWKGAMDIAVHVCKVVSHYLLDSQEHAVLLNRICNTAASVPENVAIGFQLKHAAEKTEHFKQARNALIELNTQILLCQQLADIPDIILKGAFDYIALILPKIDHLIWTSERS